MAHGITSTRLPLAAPPGRECLLDVAAVLEGTTHTSGIGWRLTTPAGPQPIRTSTRRYGQTLISSQLAAVRRGLNQALRSGCSRLRVRVRGAITVRILNGEELLRYRRATLTARRMKPLVDRFEWIHFDPEPREDLDLRQAAGEALDVGLLRAAQREELRGLVLERVIERARDVRLEERDGRWIANENYRVELDPMRCECPAWSARWARIPIAARRGQRLPCKHIVALGLRKGIAVPAELAAMARKAVA